MTPAVSRMGPWKSSPTGSAFEPARRVRRGRGGRNGLPLRPRPLHACAARTAAYARFSRRLHCPDCDLEFRRPEPRLFSPNSPLGACPECQGFGRSIQPDFDEDPARPRPDAGGGPDRPLEQAVLQGGLRRSEDARGNAIGLRWDRPYAELPEEHRRLVEEGGTRLLRNPWLLRLARAAGPTRSTSGSSSRATAPTSRVRRAAGRSSAPRRWPCASRGVDIARQCPRCRSRELLGWVERLEARGRQSVRSPHRSSPS